MQQTDITTDSIAALEFSKPCETSIVKCHEPATYAVWCDHHGLSCDYSGFRCELHRIFLEREIREQIDAVNAGYRVKCLRCGERITGGDLSAHFRYVKL